MFALTRVQRHQSAWSITKRVAASHEHEYGQRALYVWLHFSAARVAPAPLHAFTESDYGLLFVGPARNIT
jgi:hypothetical protein